MTGGFNNPIIGGGGNLVYPGIQSPNFNQANQTGWAILKNGQAFFYAVTVIGTIIASQFQGVNFVINSLGAFWYSGTPAFGNLIVSVAVASGADPYGNTYPEGIGIAGGGSLIAGNTIVNTSGIFVYGAAAQVTVTKTVAGSGNIPIPAAGVLGGTVLAETWGAGGGGAAAGRTGNTAGNGGDSKLTGTSGTPVTGHGGKGASLTSGGVSTAGLGGTGYTGTTHHDGGAGALGTANVTGGGGGSSAGPGAAGNPGSSSGPGGVAPTGGGNGGKGHGSGGGPTAGSAPGGGGGGGFANPAGGGAQAGGGGGEYAAEPALAVTAGGNVAYVVGAAGAGGVDTGDNGAAGAVGKAQITYQPATNALVASLAGAGGTDSFGNTFKAGVVAYVTVTGTFAGTYAIELNDQLQTWGATVAALVFQNLTNAANLSPAITAQTHATAGNNINIQSGKSTAGATGATIQVQDSVSSSHTGGLVDILAGALQVLSQNGDGNTYNATGLVSVKTTGTQGISSTTPVAVTGLSIPVAAGKYRWRAIIPFKENASNDAYLYVQGPTTSTFHSATSYGVDGGAVQSTIGVNTNMNSFPLTAEPGTNGAHFGQIQGFATFTAAGNLSINAAASANVLTFTIQAGAILEVWPES